MFVRKELTMWDVNSFALSEWKRLGDLPWRFLMKFMVVGMIVASCAREWIGMAIRKRDDLSRKVTTCL